MTDDEVETGIGPVLAFADFRVKWTFIGFDWLKLRDNEEPKGQKAKGSIGKALESEGGEFAFHGLTFECFADREELFRLAGLRMHGPDRRLSSTNKTGRLGLAATHPLAALQFQVSRVKGFGHSGGPEVNRW